MVVVFLAWGANGDADLARAKLRLRFEVDVFVTRAGVGVVVGRARHLGKALLDRHEVVGGMLRLSNRISSRIRGPWCRGRAGRAGRATDGLRRVGGKRRGRHDQCRCAREAAAGRGGRKRRAAVGTLAAKVVLVELIPVPAGLESLADCAGNKGLVHLALEGLGRAKDDEAQEAGRHAG